MVWLTAYTDEDYGEAKEQAAPTIAASQPMTLEEIDWLTDKACKYFRSRMVRTHFDRVNRIRTRYGLEPYTFKSRIQKSNKGEA